MIRRLLVVVTVRRAITKLRAGRPRLDPYTSALTVWSATVSIDAAVLVWMRGGRFFLYRHHHGRVRFITAITIVFTFHSRAVCCRCQCLIQIRLAVHILFTSLLLHAERAIVT